MRFASLVMAVVAGLAVVPAAGAWTWPVDGPVLRPFALGDDAYAGGQHRGVDVGGAAGDVGRAPAAGRVSFAGTLPRYGHVVTIQTDRYAVTLLHLGDLAVARDAKVAEGQAIALVGRAGELEHAAPYVHLGVRNAGDDKGYVDPLTLLPARPTPAEAEPPPAAGDPQPAWAAEPAAPAAEPELPAAVAPEPAAAAPVEPVASAPAEEAAAPASTPSAPGTLLARTVVVPAAMHVRRSRRVAAGPTAAKARRSTRGAPA